MIVNIYLQLAVFAPHFLIKLVSYGTSVVPRTTGQEFTISGIKSQVIVRDEPDSFAFSILRRAISICDRDS